MAFRQPTAVPQRQSLAIDRDSQSSRPRLTALTRPVDDNQEWVLFSPTQAQSASYISTEKTPRTAGISRLSDFGSWNTGQRSIQEQEAEEAEKNEEPEDVDDLDSLDDGLQAFRDPVPDRRIDQSGGSILPGHDGLGGFPASSPPVQEQLYSFEMYNKHRRHSYGHHRTTSSVQRQLAALDEDGENPTLLDGARRDRIEKWRLDSSRIIAEELEKETRLKDRRLARAEDTDLGNVSHLDNLIESRLQRSKSGIGEDSASTQDESLWQRITRRVVEDLIGIDDDTLAVILGESLPDDDLLSKTPTPDSVFPRHLVDHEVVEPKDGWQNFLIKRLAKEIGLIARYLSGASNTSKGETFSSTMDYAGIPIDNATSLPRTQKTEESAQFFPTIRNRQIPVQRASQGHRSIINDTIPESYATPIAEAEYWERAPDLKAVFSYLSQRFVSRRYSSSAPTTSNIATTYTEESLNRAAIIQKHHPLVSRARANANRRSSFRLGSQVGPRSVASPSLKRAGTSCASWSTKRHKIGTSDGGSRNYWDIGGSIGSENAALGGNWGEV